MSVLIYLYTFLPFSVMIIKRSCEMKRALHFQLDICEDTKNNVIASKEEGPTKIVSIQEDQTIDVSILKRPLKTNIKALKKNNVKAGQKPFSRAKTEKRPVHSSRYDGIEHTITYGNSRQRCKKEGCIYKSHEMCGKCNVHLCTRKRKCFEEFHIM